MALCQHCVQIRSASAIPFQCCYHYCTVLYELGMQHHSCIPSIAKFFGQNWLDLCKIMAKFVQFEAKFGQK